MTFIDKTVIVTGVAKGISPARQFSLSRYHQPFTVELSILKVDKSKHQLR